MERSLHLSGKIWSGKIWSGKVWTTRMWPARIATLSVVVVSLIVLPTIPAKTAGAARSGQHVTSFRIAGSVDNPGVWTNERLSTELSGDVKTVTYTLKGEQSQARCVPLYALIQATRPRVSLRVKNHLLAFAVFVSADDGYTMAFSLGELAPQNGKRQVWIALDRNGQPLPDGDAPVSLIVPEDVKPSRWVHGVTKIVLVDGLESVKQTTPRK